MRQESPVDVELQEHHIPLVERFSRLPYWLLLVLLLAVLFIWQVTTGETYPVIFKATLDGVWTTVYVSFIAYALATFLGLIVGLMRVSRRRLVREAASFFVEVVRGVPMLVILYYIAFVGAPALVKALNWLGGPLIEAGFVEALSVRDLGFTLRGILALMIGYSAFISEIFRAGIQSVSAGQREAALSLGMTEGQAMRHIVLPQAIRNVLPALGNEFVAMLKSSSLVSVLGVPDITQLGKVYSASTFKFFETYNVVAFLYLIMTLGLSLIVQALERRLSVHRGQHS